MISFDELLRRELHHSRLEPRTLPPGECQTASGRRCTLCMAGSLTYEEEAGVKSRALREFWSQALGEIPLDPLVPSPKGRQYRTVSKRKLFTGRAGPELGLIDPAERSRGGSLPVIRCAIEPPEHAALYGVARGFIASPRGRDLGKSLRYAIVKGSYDEQSVILSLTRTTSGALKGANALSRALTLSSERVAGVFLYEEGPENDRYYMGMGGGSSPKLRRIFGSPTLFHRTGKRPFLYSPVSFSQVNQSILETLIQSVSMLLKLGPRDTLFDLYSGYGLFGLTLASQVARVVGVEVSPDSVRSAIENASRQGVRNARFIRAEISRATIARIFQNADRPFTVLLDPPRGGTAPGVIEALAAAHPSRAVHIFCNIDLLPQEVRRWESSGYRGVRASALDLFPGTSSVEILVLFQPEEDRDARTIA